MGIGLRKRSLWPAGLAPKCAPLRPQPGRSLGTDASYPSRRRCSASCRNFSGRPAIRPRLAVDPVRIRAPPACALASYARDLGQAAETEHGQRLAHRPGAIGQVYRVQPGLQVLRRVRHVGRAVEGPAGTGCSAPPGSPGSAPARGSAAPRAGAANAFASAQAGLQHLGHDFGGAGGKQPVSSLSSSVRTTTCSSGRAACTWCRIFIAAAVSANVITTARAFARPAANSVPSGPRRRRRRSRRLPRARIGIVIEGDEGDLLGLEQARKVLAAASIAADDHVVLARHRRRRCLVICAARASQSFAVNRRTIGSAKWMAPTASTAPSRRAPPARQVPTEAARTASASSTSANSAACAR